MLTIRKEQMAALGAAQVKKFEDRMVTHLQKHFPEQCKKLGPKLRELVAYGIERAGSYGIVAERDVSRYIDIMLAFGRDFDKDPNLPWAAAALNAKYPQGPSEKTDWLYDGAKENSKQKSL